MFSSLPQQKSSAGGESVDWIEIDHPPVAFEDSSCALSPGTVGRISSADITGGYLLSHRAPKGLKCLLIREQPPPPWGKIKPTAQGQI